MSDESTPAPTPSLSDPIDTALLEAWSTLIYFDTISITGRKNFKRLRRLVIMITFAITVTSVLTVMFEFANFMVLALPLVGLNLMNYTFLYSSSTTWIEHRYAAEQIRSEIYQYRSNAGDYNTVAKDKKDNLLGERVSEILNKAPYGIAKEDLSHHTKLDGKLKTSLDVILKYSRNDDGFSDLSTEKGLDQYIQTRVIGQKDWYQEKVRKDYHEGKRVTQIAITISAVGSIGGVILGALVETRWIGLLAIVNATSVGLNALSNVNMSGRTYGIYHKTWKDLTALHSAWNRMKNDVEMKKKSYREEKRIEFVNAIETALMGELDTWYESASEIQIANDTSLKSNIDNPTNGTAGASG